MEKKRLISIFTSFIFISIPMISNAMDAGLHLYESCNSRDCCQKIKLSCNHEFCFRCLKEYFCIKIKESCHYVPSIKCPLCQNALTSKEEKTLTNQDSKNSLLFGDPYGNEYLLYISISPIDMLRIAETYVREYFKIKYENEQLNERLKQNIF